MAAEFDRSQNKYRLRDAWKGLALQLSADCGFTIDVEHCRNKVNFVFDSSMYVMCLLTS
jgi:hypothetical protein